MNEPVVLEYGFHIAVKDSKVTTVGKGIFIPLDSCSPAKMTKLKEFLIQVYNLQDDIVPENYLVFPVTLEELQKRIRQLSEELDNVDYNQELA